MDVDWFQAYLVGLGLRSGIVRRAPVTVEAFDKYLMHLGKNVGSAQPADLEAYVDMCASTRAGKLEVLDLKRYYEWSGNTAMSDRASVLVKTYTAPAMLRELLDVDSACIENLARIGIKTNNQMLHAAGTVAQRTDLSARTGIPLAEVQRIAKLSDLMRLFGVKGIRAKLYYDMGVDTVEKMAQWDAADLRRAAVEFVERTGFVGVPTLPKEAESTIRQARELPVALQLWD